MLDTTQERVAKICSRHEKMKADKYPWLFTWQLIAEYVLSRKSNFSYPIMPGQFLTGKIFDSTAPIACRKAASSTVGALWPNSQQSFMIEPSAIMSREDAESDEVKLFYHNLTERVRSAFGHPMSGFQLALEEHMMDQFAFGTSGIYAEEDESDNDKPFTFKAVDAKICAIAEGADGFVDTVYQDLELTTRQCVQKYQYENCSKPVQEMYMRGDFDEKVNVLHAVEPRMDAASDGGFGAAGKPVASIHVDKTNDNHVLKEGGMSEMPIFIVRFWKTMREVWGRSPAGEAMSDILEVNYKRETTIVAEEKILNPPMAFYHDGSLSSGVLKLGAGDVSVFNINGRMGEFNNKVFEQLITIGDIKPTYERIAVIQADIKENFFNNDLNDLSNDSRQTAFEASIRDQMRGQQLNTIYTRQIIELLVRIIRYVFNVMAGRGLLYAPDDNPIPAAVQKLIDKKRDAYKITFISPAARILQAEELKGIQACAAFATQMAPVVPSVVDNYDWDAMARHIQDLTGAPSFVLTAQDTMTQQRQQRAAAQQAQQEQMMNHVQAQIAELLGKGAQAGSKAGLPLQALMPQPQGSNNGGQTAA